MTTTGVTCILNIERIAKSQRRSRYTPVHKLLLKDNLIPAWLKAPATSARKPAEYKDVFLTPVEGPPHQATINPVSKENKAYQAASCQAVVPRGNPLCLG